MATSGSKTVSAPPIYHVPTFWETLTSNLRHLGKLTDIKLFLSAHKFMKDVTCIESSQLLIPSKGIFTLVKTIKVSLNLWDWLQGFLGFLLSRGSVNRDLLLQRIRSLQCWLFLTILQLCTAYFIYRVSWQAILAHLYQSYAMVEWINFHYSIFVRFNYFDFIMCHYLIFIKCLYATFLVDVLYCHIHNIFSLKQAIVW